MIPKILFHLLLINQVFCAVRTVDKITDTFKSELCAVNCTCNEGLFDVWKSSGSTRLYRPVVMIHGFFSNSTAMDNLMIRIKQLHPRTQIFNLNCYSSVETLAPLWRQIEIYGKEVMAIGKAFPEGIHLLGFSQGGVIARGILQLFPNHNVRNFISLAAPQRGIESCSASLSESNVAAKCYCTSMRFNSHLGKVNDLVHNPFAQKTYEGSNDFLPVLNNELEALQQSKYKRGIIRLQHMILIGGPDDKFIVPWESCHFRFYKLPVSLSKDSIPPLKENDIYINDTIGLRTLDRAKRLRIHTVPNVDHFSWHSNNTVIDQYILPYLN